MPNLFVLSHPLFFLRDIKWHCIGRVFIALWHAITKYIPRCLDEQWYQCPINLIAYNIKTVLSIIAWHLIRDHHPVYISRKIISYLSLPITDFSCIFSTPILFMPLGLVRSKYILRRWFLYQIIIKTTIWYPQSTLFNDVFIAYLCMIFVYVNCARNQRFLMTYSVLIFLWFLSAQIALVLVPNQRFLIVHASLIFCIRGMSRHLNQCFIAKYSQLILICVGCPACAKWLSGVPRQRILMTYSSLVFCMREIPRVCAWLSGVLRQGILMKYSPLISVWFLSA